MAFNSLVFLIFLPLVVLIYYLLPHKVRYIFLLVASYVFYAFNNIWLIFLILSTTLVAYLCSLGMNKTENKKIRFILLTISLVLILGSLFTFKYLDFAVSSFTNLFNLFGAHITYNPLKLILPIGISFYTFQTLSYVIDVYKGKINAERNFGYFALFVSFFPQLVAGPIERPENLLPQLKEKHMINGQDVSLGVKYLISGYIKKVVIADFFGIYVASIYGNVGDSNGLSLSLATIFFAFQIFGDFAGYSDIAIGCAHLLGINLTKNFDRPYLSHSVREFFNRWHITLNTWLTDYIYIPLGGSKKGKIRHILNVLIVFLISGFWHGASWNYVLWGLLCGLYVVIEILLDKWLSTLRKKKIFNILSIVFTFILICFSWIFFRSSSINEAFLVIQRIFTSFISGSGLEMFKDYRFVIRVILSIALLVGVNYLPNIEFSHDEKGHYDLNKISPALSIYITLTLVVGFCYIYQLMTTGESGFIYFQF